MASSDSFMLYVQSTLGTNMAVSVKSDDTIGFLKEKLAEVHVELFPDFGEITVQALEREVEGRFYRLLGSTPVQCLTDGPGKTRSVNMVAVTAHQNGGNWMQEGESGDEATDVPDYLCCKITLGIFTDPVLTPNGITYERSALLEHFRKVGMFDPTTRKPLKRSQLIPNLAIRGAVEAYLREHGSTENMA